MESSEPREQLLAGIEILEPLLDSVGFRFHFGIAGRGSGGHFASGRFVNGHRAIELHHRWGLGIVNYHIGDLWIDHQSYLAAMGVERESHYLWLRLEAGIDRYQGLLRDLREFCGDFLTDNTDQWRKFAMSAAETREADDFKRTLGYVGDELKLQQARDAFRVREYGRVVQLLESIKHPEALSEHQQKMLEVSRKRGSE